MADLTDLTNLASFAIYATVAPSRIEPHARDGQPFTSIEGKPWKSGSDLQRQAQRAGERVAVLFSDASLDTRVIKFIAVVDSIQVVDQSTTYRVTDVRKLSRPRRTQDLILRSTENLIAPGWLRSYAIVKTPPWAHRALAEPRTALTTPTDDDLDPADYTAFEGQRQFLAHRSRERDPAIVRKKKRAVLQQTGKLACEVCDFDFREFYGKERGEGFAECHHRVHLSSYEQNGRVTTLDELAIVCGNCHRMLHRSPWCSVEDLRAEVAQRR